MINLLPETYKTALAREYKMRLLGLSCLFISYALVISLVLFFPSYIITKIRADGVAAERARKTTTADPTKDVQATIASLSASAQTAQEMAARLPTTSLFEMVRALEGKSSSIRITEIAYNNRVAAPEQIILKGVARTRESLTTFNRFLVALPFVSHVDIPISSFAKETNFPFSATLDVKPVSP